jgi:hypothetical protein
MEQWKQTDIRADYEVSNLGRVRRKIRSKRAKQIGEYAYIKGMNNGKYMQVFIRPNIVGKSKVYLIHRLVAAVFIPNTKNKLTVNHLDGNKLNNKADNLEWATHKENCQHREVTGLANKNRDQYGRYI